MSFRSEFLALLLLPGLASFSVERHGVTADLADITLVRINGRLTQHGMPFTGRLVERDSSGITVSSTMYRDGRRDGDAEAWFGNGQVRYRRTYRDGREEATHTGWWEDGRLHFVYHYRRGLIEGVAREWFPDGTPYREYHYQAGQESGSQRMWYADGTLRSNYVMRDGRRFGLPGTKGCAGLDSVGSRESGVGKGAAP